MSSPSKQEVVNLEGFLSLPTTTDYEDNYINKFGLDALYVVLSFLVGGLNFLNTSGNLILELWNRLVLSLLQSFAGIVAVLMI